MSDQPTTVLDHPVVLGSSEGTSEVQKIDYTDVTAGKTTTLTFAGETTSNLKAKAEITAAEVASKLEALSSVPDGSLTVTGSTGGPFTVEFEASYYEDDNVPAITAAAAEGSAPVVTTVTEGVSPEDAVIRGTGLADRTEDVSPLTGSSPAKHRADNAATYGD